MESLKRAGLEPMPIAAHSMHQYLTHPIRYDGRQASVTRPAREAAADIAHMRATGLGSGRLRSSPWFFLRCVDLLSRHSSGRAHPVLPELWPR